MATKQVKPGDWRVDDRIIPNDGLYIRERASYGRQRLVAKVLDQDFELVRDRAALIGAAPDMRAELGYIDACLPDIDGLDDEAQVEVVMTAAAARSLRRVFEIASARRSQDD
ncbi:MAG: hypothetical protein KKB70_05810 [Proteobacteria bacterium]|nr:hypothetical protein [Pseudomonadota bacterium]MBU1610249.1 hypothetical protein [Pseudomonadota bacterium]